jgi:hypothetical protein
MTIKSKTIAKFIEEFEAKFGEDLHKTVPIDDGGLYTTYFRIYTGKKKYSDWDIHCFAEEDADLKIIKQMKAFVESFPGFSHVGNFITNSKKHQIVQSLKRMHWVQLMGYMPKEKIAPFVDFSIFNIKQKSFIKKLYKPGYNKDFLAWSIITAWRKLKNQRYIGENSFNLLFALYILPHFSKKEDLKSLFRETEKFFETWLIKHDYKSVAVFLKK